MKKLLKLVIPIFMVTVLLLSTGLAVFSATVGKNKNALNQSIYNQSELLQSTSNQTELNQIAIENQDILSGEEAGADTEAVPTEDSTESDEVEVSISSISNETKKLIKSSDSKNYDKNLANYVELIELLNVHEKYINEMDRLLREKHKIPDILTAYSFLNDRFGMLQEIETLIQEKESGKNWGDIFEEYNKKNPEFVPGSFEAGFIEDAMKDSAITADDIMLADRVSQKTGRTIQEIMEKRMVGETWKDINAWLDIVNGEEVLPRLSVSPEQIDKYVNAGMDRDVVVTGYVIAMKMSQNADTVIKELKAGTMVEELLDRYYNQKYY